MKVLIIGGSYAGALVGKEILKNVNSAVELTLLAPSEFSLNCVSTPRILIEPEKIEKLFFNLPNQFQSQIAKTPSSKHKFKFVKAYATSVDFESKTVQYKGGEKEGELKYDYLVIATGDSSLLFFKLAADKDHEYTKNGLLGLSKRLSQARSVAVIGGGATGVEIAGELGEHYKSLETTLITGSSGPLNFLSASATKSATKQLKNLGVTIVNSKKVINYTDDTIEFEDGTKSKFDVVVPAFTAHANTLYLPEEFLDPKGYVLTDDHLNLPKHPEVFVYGDVVSGGLRTIVELKYSTPAVLKAWVDTIIYSTAGSTLKEYKKLTKTSVLVVPISRNGGIAYLFGWLLPSFFARLFKSKDFMVDKTEEMFS